MTHLYTSWQLNQCHKHCNLMSSLAGRHGASKRYTCQLNRRVDTASPLPLDFLKHNMCMGLLCRRCIHHILPHILGNEMLQSNTGGGKLSQCLVILTSLDLTPREHNRAVDGIVNHLILRLSLLVLVVPAPGLFFGRCVGYVFELWIWRKVHRFPCIWWAHGGWEVD